MNAGADRLGLFMSVTESHNKANLNRTREESFADLAAIVRDDAEGHQDPLQPVLHLPLPLRGRGAGTRGARLHRAGGGARPRRWRSRWPTPPAMPRPTRCGAIFEHAHKLLGRLRFAFHGHDTYGMGVANVPRPMRRAAGSSTPPRAASAAAPSRPAPPATWRWRTWSGCSSRMGVETGVDWPKLLAAADLAAARRRARRRAARCGGCRRCASAA